MIIIERSYLPFGTFGELKSDYNRGFHCYTVERAWLDNKQNVSCIPEGWYEAHRITYSTKTRGLDTFEFESVDNRIGIQIHHGNWPKNFLGCIGVGADIRVINEELGVSSSFDTFSSLISSLKGLDTIEVIIKTKTI